MRAGELDAYWESPGQTRRLGRSVYIEVSWLNLPTFFFTFLQHEKVYSDDRFSVKVRSCGHFFGLNQACNIVLYDIGYESKTNDIEVKLKFTPKGEK